MTVEDRRGERSLAPRRHNEEEDEDEEALELEMEHEEDEDDEPLEFVILESNTPIGKRKRSTATVSPATSQHAVPEEVVVADGEAYISVVVPVPAGRTAPSRVTVEWD